MWAPWRWLGARWVSPTAPPNSAEQQAYERPFSPESRKRPDARFSSSALTPEVIERVVARFVGEGRRQLRDRKVTIEPRGAARGIGRGVQGQSVNSVSRVRRRFAAQGRRPILAVAGERARHRGGVLPRLSS